MMKPKRLLIIGAAAIFLGVAALLVSLNSIVDKLRPEIERRTSTLLNAPVTVGRINSSIFPSIQVELRNVSIGKGDFSLARAFLAVSLGDLLSGKLNVSAITLDSLKVTVEREKNRILVGGIDLATIGKSTASPETGADVTPDAKDKTSASMAPAMPHSIAIKRVSLKNAQILVKDTSGKNPLSITLEDLQAELHNIETAGKADVNISAKILGATSANLTVTGVAGDPKKNLPLDLTISADRLSMTELQKLVGALNTLPPGLTVSNQATIKLAVRGQSGTIQISPDISLDNAGISFLPEGSQSAVFEKKSGTALNIRGDIFRERDGSAASKNLAITVGKNVLTLPFTRHASGKLDCSIQGKQFQLADLATLLSPLQEIKLAGESDIALDLKLESAQAPLTTPPVNGPLVNGPVINGSAVFKNVSSIFSGVPIAGAGGNLSFADDTLTLTNFAGSLRDIPLSGKASVLLPTSTSRQVNLKESEFGLFGGSVTVQAIYALPPATAGAGINNDINLITKATGLDAGAISKAFLAQSPISLLGRVQSFDLSITASSKEPKQTVRGSTNFIVTDGSIEGLNVISQSFAGAARIPGVSENLGKLLPPELLANGSAFKQLRGNATLNGPTIQLSDISLYHELYEIHGNGTITTAGTAELKTQVKLLSKLTSQMLAKEKKLSLLLDKQGSMIFPVTISKSQSGVVVLPDFEQLLERAAGNTAKEAAGKALEKVAPGLGGAAKGLLDKLF